MHCPIAGQDVLLSNRMWSNMIKQWLPANGCAHAALFHKDTLGLVCFNLFFFFNFIFFKLYNIVLILPNIKRNPPQVYPCSPSWTLLPPPFPYPPSGSSQCTSPKYPVSCIKPGLATRFIHDIIHVSMPFSQISHPLPLPQSPKDWSIHSCLVWYLAYRVITTIFLNSIYMH